jgi:hypothetical protein
MSTFPQSPTDETTFPTRASPPRLRGAASPSHSQEAILESKYSHDAVSALLDSLSLPKAAQLPSPSSGLPMPQQTTAPKHNPAARNLSQSPTIRTPQKSDESQTRQAAPPAKPRRTHRDSAGPSSLTIDAPPAHRAPQPP